MALSQEDLDALDAMIANRVKSIVGDEVRAQAPSALPEQTEEEKQAEADREYTLKAGRPDVDPESGPEYYVHLANGDVITTRDSGSTHMSVDGETVAVIGRYLKHEPTGEK